MERATSAPPAANLIEIDGDVKLSYGQNRDTKNENHFTAKYVNEVAFALKAKHNYVNVHQRPSWRKSW